MYLCEKVQETECDRWLMTWNLSMSVGYLWTWWRSTNSSIFSDLIAEWFGWGTVTFHMPYKLSNQDKDGAPCLLHKMLTTSTDNSKDGKNKVVFQQFLSLLKFCLMTSSFYKRPSYLWITALNLTLNFPIPSWSMLACYMGTAETLIHGFSRTRYMMLRVSDVVTCQLLTAFFPS